MTLVSSVCIPVRFVPRSGFAGARRLCAFVLGAAPQGFPCEPCQPHPRGTTGGSGCSTSLLTLGSALLLSLSHWWYAAVVLVCISSPPGVINHLGSSFVKTPVCIFCPFFIWIPPFLWVISKNHSCISDTGPSLGACRADCLLLSGSLSHRSGSSDKLKINCIFMQYNVFLPLWSVPQNVYAFFIYLRSLCLPADIFLCCLLI